MMRLFPWLQNFANPDSPFRDFLTGIMLIVALALLLNRGLFGIETGEGWTVSYGIF